MAHDIEQDVAAIGRMDVVPTLLRVLCETTGMGFAAVARVTEGSWTACAVQDDIEFGVLPGQRLDVHTTLCREVRATRMPVVIEQASTDPVYRSHHTPRIYAIESYVSVPIELADGEYFGNLCAIDRRPARLAEPRIVETFHLFARLIALQLQNDRRREQVEAALLDERSAGELREQFIAVLGHDLRNPLAAVSAGAEVLRRRSSDPVAVVEIAARIGRSVRRMSLLIDDVLDFARGRLGGGIGVSLRDVSDLGEALASVVSELRDTHPARRIESAIAIDRDVRCDRSRLQQLVSNLLANALTHGAPGGPVRLSATTGADGLTIEVWNEGPPISPDQLTKVFAPFSRHGDSSDRDGLGLGLYICSQIVASHGGTLQTRSSVEDGTRFTARLPRGACRAGTGGSTDAPS